MLSHPCLFCNQSPSQLGCLMFYSVWYIWRHSCGMRIVMSHLQEQETHGSHKEQHFMKPDTVGDFHVMVIRRNSNHCMLTLALLNFLRKHIKNFLRFLPLINIKIAQDLKSFLLVDKDPIILHIQHNGCWHTVNARSHGINRHSNNLVIPEYFSFSTRRFKIRLKWYITSCML